MNLKRKGMMEYIHIRLRGPPGLPMSATRLPGFCSWRNWRTRGQALPCRSLKQGAVPSYTSCTCCFSSWAAAWSILGRAGRAKGCGSERAPEMAGGDAGFLKWELTTAKAVLVLSFLSFSLFLKKLFTF